MRPLATVIVPWHLRLGDHRQLDQAEPGQVEHTAPVRPIRRQPALSLSPQGDHLVLSTETAPSLLQDS